MNIAKLFQDKKFVRNFIFSVIILLFVVFVGIGLIALYSKSHTYYYNDGQIRGPAILTNISNRGVYLWGLVIACIPVLYLLFSKKPKIGVFTMFVFAALIIFGFMHTAYKGGLVGPSSSFVFIFNIIILFGLSVYFLLGTLSIGNIIAEKLLKFVKHGFAEMFFNLGIGIAVLMLVVNFLIIGHIFYRPIAWFIFISFGVSIYLQRPKLKEYASLIETSTLSIFYYENIEKKPYLTIGVVLLVFSILYYFLGFHMSWIPYSTARDANHAYMYIPKVFAENHGTWNGSPGGLSPMLWYSYVAFRFGLIEPIKSRRLGPNTVPVEMNFLSGVLVLIFGLGLISQALKLFESIKNNKINLNKNNLEPNLSLDIKENSEKTHILTFFGWFLLILRLTSGMGAFLVFVDNKTDLGVMAITMLAILSGFIFLEKIISNLEEQKQKMSARGRLVENILHNPVIKYVIVSAMFFVVAVMAKMTAFQDVLTFGLLLIGFWFSSLIVVGLGILFLGILSKLVVLASSLFIPKIQATPYLVSGIVCIIAGISERSFRTFQDSKSKNTKKRTNNINDFLQNQYFYFKYLFIRGVSFVIFLVVLKGPQVLYNQIANDNFSPVEFAKGLLMGYMSPQSAYAMESSSSHDNSYITSQQIFDDRNHLYLYCPAKSEETGVTATLETPADQCSRIDSKNPQNMEKLFTGLQENVGGGLNEDLQRYIGFGQRTFNPNSSIGRGIMTIFTPSSPGCYGWNTDAKIICQNMGTINNRDTGKLQNMLNQIDPNSDAYRILSCNLGQTLSSPNKDSGQNNIIFKENIDRLTNFYKEFVIQRNDNGSIAIPYRYIVPYNISIINDLQNNTSYYTDIGYIRYFCLFLVILGTIYLFTCIEIKNYNITNKYSFILNLHIVAIMAWVIRWVIGSAIMRYGVGLIAWTILANIGFFWAMLDHKNIMNKIIVYTVIGIFTLSGTYQLIINFVRISSQGGMAVSYKGNSSLDYKYMFKNGRLDGEQVINTKFTRKDIFDMQFGQYNVTMDYLKNRSDEDGVMIGGTYIQYFLDNQKNMLGDGLLTQSRQRSSDYNVCNFRNRYRAKNVKYIVADQNILSIIMGGGNDSLKDRMFGKVDPISGILTQDGVFAMYVRMIQNGYMKLNYTSNLASKYALTLSDDELLSYLSNDPNLASALEFYNKDKVQFRAKVALFRYFPESYQYAQYLTQKVFLARMQNGQAMQDIADIYGKKIDMNKLLNYVQKIQSVYSTSLEDEINTNLTQDEIIVLGQYMNGLGAIQNSNQQYSQEFLKQIFTASFSNNSQYMFFELK